jgi:predicted anti-sigma-YlaC factor YlaD
MKHSDILVLDCRQVLASLSCWLDGDGTAELRAAIERHLARCGRCRVLVDTTRHTLRLLVETEPFEVPLAVSARLYARLEQALRES